MTTARRVSMFKDERLTLPDALELTAESLVAHGSDYRHWVVACSGGKDSVTVATTVQHLILTGRIPAPESLTILLADTKMELLPLLVSALRILDALRERGATTRIVVPALDRRFFVYMLGRGVPPPRPGFRWCTGALKVDPMAGALEELRATFGEKPLLLTGVRLGESAVRDRRIALSCSKDGAECGQGWLQIEPPKAVADVLAPILHWRVCHVWDWLSFDAPRLGYPTGGIAEIYGGDEAAEINARTGCVACNVASRETSLETVLALPDWAYLAPYRRLRPLYAELVLPKHRLRKNGQERYADGRLFKNPNRLGPLLFDSRRWGLAQVLAIQSEINDAARAQCRPEVSLIDAEEQARIEELIAAETWPDGWDGTEAHGDDLLSHVVGEGLIQPLIFALGERLVSRALDSERARVASEALRARLELLDAPPPPPVLLARPAPPDRRIAEAPFQGLILDIAGYLNWEHYHTLDSRGSDPGWPDLVLARRTGPHGARIIFRELKTEKGRLTEAQARWGRLLLAAGFDWGIWRPSDWDAILDTLTTI